MPPYISVPLGEVAVFSCFAYENYTIDWRFSKGKLPPNIEFYTKGKQHNLVINSVDIYNVGIYTCTMEKDMLIYEGEGELSGTYLLEISSSF